jgi:O-antigen ligase
MKSLQRPWEAVQLGMLLFPLSPFLGGLCVVGATLVIWIKKFQTLARSRINQGLGLFLLLLILSCFFANDRQVAWLGFFNFFPFLFIFAALRQFIQIPVQLRRLAWAIAIASVPVVIIGFGQMCWGWQGPIDILMLINWQIAPTGNPPGRMSSVFEYANVYASYLVIVLALGFGLWIDRLRQWDNRMARWQLAGLSLLLLGNAIALILTHSRNAWAVAFLIGLSYAIYLSWYWLVAGVAALAAMVLGSAFAPAPVNQGLRAIVPRYFWARLTDEMHPDRPVALLRTTQWQFALDMSADRPVWGWGLRNFTPLYEAKMQLWLGHPHNIILMLAAETGLPATILLCAIAGWIGFRGVKSLPEFPPQQRLMLFAYLVAFGGITLFHLLDVTLYDSRINLLGWLLLAGIGGVAMANEDSGERCF